MTRIVYIETGEFVVETDDDVVLVDPSLEWAVCCLLSFVPVRFYGHSHFRIPIQGERELGKVGRRTIIASDAPGAMRNAFCLRMALLKN